MLNATTLFKVIVGLTLSFRMVGASAEGTIAQGDDGRVGLSYNHDSSTTADYAALNNCGADCKVVDHFHEACAAIARDRFGGVGYGIKPHEGQAQQEAFLVCKRQHHGCGLAVSGCDHLGN